jgi:phosphatidylserine/phosphatidylglycerophosphate/cardiolipin synthase-like enzyme
MLHRTWYRRLARINRLIADARRRIEIQTVLISQLVHKKRSTNRAFARLRQFEVELRLLVDQRAVILAKVRRSPLPEEIWRASGVRPTPVQRFPDPESPVAS